MLDAMSRARPARPTRATATDGGRSGRRPARHRHLYLALGVLLGLAACVPQRILTVESYPPGAIVRLDERVIGRTPLEYHFNHYGKRRITLYLPGYRTWSRRLELSPPWHARFPIDVVTELLIPIGLHDEHEVWVVLENDEVVGGQPDLAPLLERAHEMRARGAQIRAEEFRARRESQGEVEPPAEDVPEAPPEEQP